MSEREVRIKFTGDSAVLKGAAGDVRKIFQNLVADENDARGAGEKLADAQRQVAANMRKSMAEISEAADVLADSLGPDMVRAIEATGRSVEDEVVRWQKMGLTLDDVKRDSDMLAAGMRDLDDASRMSAGNVGDGLKKVADGSDRARSAMGGFVGGAVTELPMVSGAFGPLTQGIDEMTSALVEGDIKMGQLAATGGTMAAVAVAVQLVTKYMKEMEEVKAFNKGQVDGFVESLKAGADVAEDFRQSLLDAGKVEFALNRMFSGDVLDDMARAGLTFEQFFAAVEGGKDGLDRLATAMQAAGVAGEDQFAIMAAATTAQENLTQAHKTYAQLQQVELTSERNLSDERDRGTDSLVAQVDATTASALAQESLTAAVERSEAAQRDLNAAQLASIDSAYAVADAQDRFTQSMEAMAVATDKPETGVNELDQAQRSAEQAALAMAQANVANAEALAEAAGAPLSAAQSNYLLIESLYATALSMDENSPVRAALLAHIGTLQSVPPTANTTVTADTTQAQENIGKVLTDAEKLNTETDTKANAETATALEAVQTLQGAVDGLAKGVSIPLATDGYVIVLSQIRTLVRELEELITVADRADRAVARVAG